MPIIEVDHVTKEFRLGQLRSLRQTLADGFARLRGNGPPAQAPFKALDDVSFSVEQGEVLGIIGHNGAGKSTMLKLLARIIEPTSGRVRVGGKVAPLIEVGAGLVGELTGRENIFLNGAILGMKRARIARKLDEIVAFAELERFIDTPLKRYSSGMQVRLGFAIATSVDADVLIVDEVLAVGDLAFQRKCYDRMQEMITREGRTVLMVSHNLREVDRLCSRVILLERGRIVENGPPKRVCSLFYERSNEKVRSTFAAIGARGGRLEASGEVELTDIDVLDAHGAVVDTVKYEAPFAVRIRMRVVREITDVIFELGFHTSDFLYIATLTSDTRLALPRLARGDHEIVCRFDRMPLLPGVYSLRLHVGQGFANHGVFSGESLRDFRVELGEREVPIACRQGFVEIDGQWSARADVVSSAANPGVAPTAPVALP